jgi:hypothetical protein
VNKKVAIFSPFSNIWDHTYPEALIASGLRDEGWDISYLNCDGVFSSHCVAMSAASVDEFAAPATRSQICRACHKRRDLTNTHFTFESSRVERYLRAEDARLINGLVDDVRPDTWTALEIDGVPLGRYAIYELWLNNKLVSTQLPDDLWPIYLGQLRNTLVAYFAAQHFLRDKTPNVALVYNDHYSVNHAFTAAARKLGIPSYSIHGGWHMVRRGESMAIMRSDYTMADVFSSPGWERYKDKPLSDPTVELVAEHFEGLWAGSSAFAYSSGLVGTGASDLRAKFGIEENAKVLLAAMSSEDELMGVQLIGVAPKSTSQESLFADQFEWVKHLIDLAARNTDYHLIVRLHPRMFPNKRELKMSPVVESLMALRERAPLNVTFNVPEDGVGLYDLVQIVDVLLNFRSSVGAEVMALGLPVVVPSNSNFYTYPNEINIIANTRLEFDALIATAAEEGWSLENARKAFRWFGFLFDRVSVNFTETFTSRPTALRPKKPGLKLWLWKKLVYVVLQYGPLIRERLALRKPPLPPSAIKKFAEVLESELDTVSDSTLWASSSATENEETQALRAFFRRLTSREWAGVQESNSLAGRVRMQLEIEGSVG